MCGIAGIVDWRNKDWTDTVQKMNDRVYHRGPDDGGVIQLMGACLGHRRLAIIDLSNNAGQPMKDGSGRYWVTFNGEIYGYKTLREKLLNNGVKLRSTSDTEILAEGMKMWGIEGLCQRLSGMFAFAIWDNIKQVLFLARDRFGEKPIYYMHENGVFRFSSFSKALYIDNRRPELNPDGVFSFLSQGFCTPEVPIFKGLSSVSPGTYCIIEPNKIESRRYWNPSALKEILPVEDWMNRIEKQLTTIVEDELVSDVPAGALLSGGVDSSLIASIAVTIRPEIELFTVKMSDKEFDETPLAKMLVERIGGNHRIIPADPIKVEEYTQLMQQFSEPLGDSSAIAMWIVSRAAKKYTKVFLTGDGGDEMFAGYDTITLAAKMKKYRRLLNNKIGSALNSGLHYCFFKKPKSILLRKFATFIGQGSTSALSAHAENSMIADRFSMQILGPRLTTASESKNYIEKLESFLRKSAIGSELDALMALDIKNKLAGDYLPKVDVASMQHSVEARSPFLHHKLAELSYRIPVEMKRYDNQPKGMLKKILQRRVGDQTASGIINGKRGFVVPVDRWLDSHWSRMVKDIPRSPLVAEGWLDQKGVMLFLQSYSQNPSVYSRLRYNLIAFDHWYSDLAEA